MSPAHVRFEHPNRNKRPTPRSSLQAPADGNSDDEILGEGMKQKLTVQTTPGSGKKNMVKALFKALPTPVKSSQVMVDSSIGVYSCCVTAMGFMEQCADCVVQKHYRMKMIPNSSQARDALRLDQLRRKYRSSMERVTCLMDLSRKTSR